MAFEIRHERDERRALWISGGRMLQAEGVPFIWNVFGIFKEPQAGLYFWRGKGREGEFREMRGGHILYEFSLS